MSFLLSYIENFPSATLSEELALETYACILHSIKDTHSAFRFFAAMNLLNAYVKLDSADKDFKKQYNFKYYVSKGIEQIILKNIPGIQLYITKSVAYIKFDEIQFSFHNITITPVISTFMTSDNNKLQTWLEIRLQPIAYQVYSYAKTLNYGTSKK